MVPRPERASVCCARSGASHGGSRSGRAQPGRCLRCRPDPVIGAPGAAVRTAGGTCAHPGAAGRLCATGGLCPLSVRRPLPCMRRTGGDGSPGSHGLSMVRSDDGAVDLSRVRRSCPEDGDGRFHAHGGGARAGFSRYPCGGLGSTGGPRCRGRGRQLTASCRGHTWG